MSRAAGRDAGALLAGTVVNGAAAYVYIAAGTRALGASAFAPVSVVWTIWMVSVAVLVFPIQHWVIRTLRADGDGARIRAALPALALVVAGLAAGTGAVAWLLRHELFAGDGPVFPLLAALVTAGSGVIGLLRGGLAGRERFIATGAAIAGENVLRAGAGGVALLLDAGPAVYGAMLVVGPCVALLWPGALRFSAGSASPPRLLGLLAGISGASTTAQVVLLGAPLALALAGGAPAQVTGVFSALALFRAPYLLALGLSNRVTGPLTGYVLEGRRGRLTAVIRWVLAGTLGVAVAAAAFGAIAGPWLLGAMFALDGVLSPGTLALLCAGSAAALGTLVLTLVLVACARTRAAVVAWGSALMTAVAWVVVAPAPPVVAVGQAFLAAELLALVLLGATAAAAVPRSPASQEVQRALR